MSAPVSATAPSRARRPQTPRTRLRLVAPVRARATRTPFVVVVMVVVAAGLSGLILISTLLQGQSFELSRLHQQSNALTTQHDARSEERRVGKEGRSRGSAYGHGKEWQQMRNA